MKNNVNDTESIFNNTGKLLIIVDTEGKISRINNETETLTKFPIKKITGKKLENLLHFEAFTTIGLYNQLVETAGKTGSLSLETGKARLVTEKENVTDVEGIASLVVTSEGKPGGMVLVLQTINADKKNSVSEITDFSAAILNTLSAHICVLDEKGNIIFVNKAWHDFAKANPPVSDDHYVCDNYLEICDKATGMDAIEAARMAEGIRKVGNGTLDHFQMEYPCHSSDEKRWFIAHVRRFVQDGSIRIVISHENITDRVMAEQQQLKSVEQYQYLFENNPHPMWAYDIETLRFLAVNGAATEKYGYTVNEFLNMTLADIRPADEVQRLLEHVIGKKQDLQHSGNWKHKLKNGSLIDVEIHSHTIELDGKSAVLVVAQDISERMRAEQTTHAALMKYKTLFDDFPLGITLSDEAGNIIEANSVAGKLLGISAEELLKRQLNGEEWQIIHTDGTPMSDNEFASVKALKENRKIENMEMGIVKPDLSVTWINVTASPVQLNHPGVLVTFEDITERKIADEKLRNSEELLKVMGKTAHIGGWELDVISGEGQWTEEVASIHDLGPDIQPNQKMGLSFYTPESKKLVEKAVKNAIEKGISYDLEVEIISAKGTRKWIRTIGNPVFENGEVVRLRGSFQDITEHILAVEALRESEKRFFLIFEYSPIGIGISRVSDQKILNVNSAFSSLFGFSNNEAIGHTTEELRIWKNPDEKIRFSDRLKASGHVSEFEATARLKSGEERKVMVWGEMIELNHEFCMAAHVIDISDRKLAEEKLIRNEKVLRLFVEHSPAAIAMLNKEMKYIITSRRFLKDYNLPDQDLTGRSHYEIFPEISEHWKEIHRRCMNGAIEKAEADPFPRADGRLDWIRWEIHPWFKNEGEIGGIILFSEIITERIKAENEIRESEKKYRDLINNMNDTIFLVDNDMSIIDANQTATRILGYSREELLSMKIPDIDSNLNPLQIKNLVDTLPEVKTQVFETTHKTKEGHIIPVEVSSGLVTYAGKEVILSIARDITDRKIADEALRTSEERFRTVADFTYDWEYWVTPEKQFIYVSPACKRITGFEVYDFYKNGLKIWDKIIFPDDLPAFLHHLDEETLVEKTFSTDIRIVRKDGEIRWINHVCQSVYGTDGNWLGRRASNRDITDRKQAEEDLLKAKNKAEESDRLKTVFLTNISHEIRTPMNGILGFTNLLENSGLSEINRKEYIEIIKRSGERMLNTINDLIEISSIESGVVSVQNNEIPLNDFFYYLKGFFELQTSAKGLTLSCKMAFGDNFVIISDRKMLEGILMNLIRNAIKFTDNGSIEFGYRTRENKLEFYVTDTGIGIPPDRLDAIFERFVQADLSFTRSHEGSGLGLSIAKAYINLLNGTIRVDSEVNKGSTFTFDIPLKIKVPKNFPGKTDTVSVRKCLEEKGTLLIAEDDEVNFNYLKLALSPMFRTIIRAGNGQEAVQLCMADPGIHIVLMDIKMPVMDGYEATLKIRDFNKEIIIIAQTAYAFIGERKIALEMGCNDYIAKPFNSETLLDLIVKNIKKKE